MEAHELAQAAKYIGAGLAAIGTGAAGIGVGTLFGQFLNGALRNPERGRRPVRPPDLRLRGDRSARHFRAADRVPAAVRRLTRARSSTHRGKALSRRLPAIGHLKSDGQSRANADPSSDPDGSRPRGRRPVELSALRRASTFPSQLLWLAISFGALYDFMAKMALPKIGAAIQERKARIAKDLDDATAMQQKADAAAAEHQKALAEARAKAQGLAQAARDRSAAESEAKRKALDEQLAAKFAAAESQIAATRAEAMSSVGDIARDAAGAIVERLIGRPAKAEAIAAAVDSLEAN